MGAARPTAGVEAVSTGSIVPFCFMTRGIGAGGPYVEVQPLDARARPQRIHWEVAATLFTAFGIIAALLAAVGL
jgi:hypothetical protein